MTDQYTGPRARATPTEPGSAPARADGPRRRPKARPKAWPTVLAAIACFGVAFEFLAFQLYSGQDPALGISAFGQASESRPVKKRIIITRAVGSTDAATSPGGSSSSSYSAPAPAPVATSSS